MGATSMNIPAIFMPAGPMLRGNWRGNTLGSGSDAWKYWAELRAGNIDQAAWREIEEGIARGPGHCMTMGTASTMGAIAERSEEHTSELQSLMRSTYAVFCLKKKKK